MDGRMETLLTFRGRQVTSKDVEFIRDLIDHNPDDHRTALSRRICKLWNWTQPNGYLKDAVCRSLLLRLQAEGFIKLPPKRCGAGGRHFVIPEPVSVDQTPISTDISSLRPISIRQVRRTHLEPLHDALLAQFHYLGYTRPVGEHLKYLAFANQRPLACLTWSSAPRHIGCRDRFIGWDPQTRPKNIHLLAYNTRFLLLPWVRSHCLASHLLSTTARTLSSDWQKLYAHPVYWIETFIDTDLFTGTCYKAANWIYLGNTTGRGKDDLTHRPNRSIKAVWGYPLCSDFRCRLCHG